MAEDAGHNYHEQVLEPTFPSYTSNATDTRPPKATTYAGLSSKILPLPCLFATSIVSSLLLCANATGWKNTGTLYTAATVYRASVQIVVSIIAGSLAACQTFTVCTLIKLHSNTRISLRATSLDHLKFLAALQRVEFHFDLPF